MGSVYDAMSGYIAMVLSFFGWGVAAAHNPGLFQSIVQLPMDFYIILGALSGIFVIFPRFIMHKAITTLGDQGSMKTVKDKSEYGFVKLIALNDLRKERSMLENEQGELGNMKKNFDFFIDCLKQLPEQNTAGMPLKVYGLNVQSSAYRDEDGNPTSTRKRSLKLTPELIAEAPDLLHFEKGIYCAFIEKGTVKGDVVEFKTTFGVTLTTVGNRRTLNSFRGFKRCNMDGTVEYVDILLRKD